MNASQHTNNRPLVGAGSLIEYYGQDWRVLSFLLRAQFLHDAHPTIAAAVADHSTVFSDPGARAWRTLGYAMRLVLGPDVEQAAHEVRELHRDLKGTDDAGKKYHAWQRESWTYAHLTLAEATIHALPLFYDISDADLEEVYASYRHVGALYGVRDDDMPATVAGLDAWFGEAVRTRTADTRLTRTLSSVGESPWPFPPPGRMPVWFAKRATAHAIKVTVGVLPESQHERFAPRRTALHRAEWSTLMLMMRAASVLPRRMLVLPNGLRQRALASLEPAQGVAA